MTTVKHGGEDDNLAPAPDISHLITESDAPLNHLPGEKNQRLLTEPLYTSWSPEGGQTFLVAANVGVFASTRLPPLVPDVFVSLGVEVHPDWAEKRHRTYLLWEFGKPPDVAVEIVSNREGNELGSKLGAYARMGVPYYAVYDPFAQLGELRLRSFRLVEGRYVPQLDPFFEHVGLGLVIWTGEFEGVSGPWLRWCDRHRALIPTGAERAETERARAETERARAETERARADARDRRAARLIEQLKAAGIEPDITPEPPRGEG